jgi:SsrA-binding protein
VEVVGACVVVGGTVDVLGEVVSVACVVVTVSVEAAVVVVSSTPPRAPSSKLSMNPATSSETRNAPRIMLVDSPRRPALRPLYTGAVEKLIVDNRRARHDYHLLERVEAGLVLTGTEVKSLRDGRASLQQAYAEVRNGEAWLVGAHISVYEQGNTQNHDPDRDRKLLLHRRELDSLAGKVRERGLTLVPTKLYFRDGRAKVELALARGKELRDKRRDIANREAQRDMERALKSRSAR